MSVRIHLYQTSAEFTPGTEISGKVVLESWRCKILGLKINMFGKVRVTSGYLDGQFSRGLHRRLSLHSGSESDFYFILEESKTLSRNDSLVGNPFNSTPTYEYPFSFWLPENIPASFEGPYGFIRYSLEVIVRYSFWEQRCEAEAEFQVTGCYDLNNLDPIYSTSVTEQKSLGNADDSDVNDVFESMFLNLVFVLDKRAYVPGEPIKFSTIVDYRRPGRHPPIPGVRVAFVQEQTYRINGQIKRHSITLKDIQGRGILSNVTDIMNDSLVVPLIPPTALGGPCRLIDVQYYLRTKLITYGNEHLEVSIPLEIGTIPLRRSQPSPPPPPRPSSSPPPLFDSQEPAGASSSDDSDMGREIAHMDFLSVPTNSYRRRVNAPAQPRPGPSWARDSPDLPPSMAELGLDTPPPSYPEAVFVESGVILEPPNAEDNYDHLIDYPPRRPPFIPRNLHPYPTYTSIEGLVANPTTLTLYYRHGI